jgi:periplasmic divalent cation tolerance protein
MTVFVVYVTTANQAEALAIGRATVDSRLAACANILGPTKSIYAWRGEVCEGSEVALLLKTNAAKLEALTRLLKDLHSYDCPCVVALPVVAGNPEFLDWIDSQISD